MTVSHSSRSSNSNKSSTKSTSTSAPATGGATSTQAPIDTLASQAIAALDTLESSLNLNIVVPPNDVDQLRALNRVTNAAIDLAAQIVNTDAQRFSDFADLPAAADFVEAMTRVSQRAALFATHVRNGLQSQRSPAATKTLALYAVVKGLGRIVGNQTMRELIPQLKAALVPPRKNPKPKETVAQKAVKRAAKSQQKKVQKALQVLGSAGVAAPPAATSPAASPTPAVNATPATTNGAAPATTNGAAVTH